MRPELLQKHTSRERGGGRGGGGRQEVGGEGRVGQSEVLNNENRIQFLKRHFRKKKKTQIDVHIKFPLLQK